jgi:hypothetical protein
MAEDKVDGREVSWRQMLSWTELFRGFQVALDLNKLLLAAAGILTMAAGWFLLAVIFTANESSTAPSWPGAYGDTPEGWVQFRQDRAHWNLMNEAAGLSRSDRPAVYEIEDIAESLPEYNLFKDLKQSPKVVEEVKDRIASLRKQKAIEDHDASKYETKASQYAQLGEPKRSGLLVVGPWYEDRGPNPYLLLTGQAGVPWETGHFWEWFVRDQGMVMIEPLVKFVRPIVYFFSPRGNNFKSRFYFLSVMLLTLVVWSFFGGAITRIAAVQIARGEKIGMFEALRFTFKRWLSYITAPLFPLGFVFFLLILMAIFGLFGMIPYFGDVLVSGLFWPIMLVFGLVMAVALVGLVGWPLMSATISTEGTDSWEAVSRSYSYVFQRPWNYAWYSVVAICYGAVVVFFVGFMGSLTVYLAKWGVAQTPFIQAAKREPSFLFVYAPTSFGWRELLLEGTQTDSKTNLVAERASRAPVVGPGAGGSYNRWNRINDPAYQEYVGNLNWGNKAGAFLVGFWLSIVFLLVLGFGYSYFWTASTIIYLLMRRNVDSAELDEVYLEEDDQEGTWAGSYPGPHASPNAAPSAAAAKPGTSSLPVVEAPKPHPQAPVTMVMNPPKPPDPLPPAGDTPPSTPT